jgi:preprotein translocase subunit YajC
MKMLDLLALAPATTPGAEPNPQGQMLQMIGMFVILGLMFYFLLIRPQQKQRKTQDNMIKNIKSGDRVLTTGGIYGIVTNVKEKSLMLKIADNVKIEITKSAVGSVIQRSAESDSAGN